MCSQKQDSLKCSKKNVMFTIFWENMVKVLNEEVGNFYEKKHVLYMSRNCFAACDLLSNNNKVTPSIMQYAIFSVLPTLTI